ncbi:transporter substrate-binding domain-containing protein, partial [Rhizobium phaseoli]
MRFLESFPAVVTPLRAGLMACLLAAGMGSAAAADNPYKLIEPGVISVGTMGDAKPYTFATADGQFTGFDIELFLNVVSRLGFPKDKVTFTGQEFSALLPSVANERFDV